MVKNKKIVLIVYLSIVLMLSSFVVAGGPVDISLDCIPTTANLLDRVGCDINFDSAPTSISELSFTVVPPTGMDLVEVTNVPAPFTLFSNYAANYVSITTFQLAQTNTNLGALNFVVNGGIGGQVSLSAVTFNDENGAPITHTLTPSNSVAIAAAGPSCGNGVVESGEQCDDSNVVNEDGCSDTCQWEDNDADTFFSNVDCNDDDDTLAQLITCYTDVDLDGYGDPLSPSSECALVCPSNLVSDNTDCQPTDPDINPGEDESQECGDGVDNDCDNLIDTADPQCPADLCPDTICGPTETATSCPQDCSLAACTSQPNNIYGGNCNLETDCDVVSGVWFEGTCYNPAIIDYIVPSSIDQADVNEFLSRLSAFGLFIVTSASSPTRYDLSGNGVLDYEDIKIFIQIYLAVNP